MVALETLLALGLERGKWSVGHPTNYMLIGFSSTLKSWFVNTPLMLIFQGFVWKPSEQGNVPLDGLMPSKWEKPGATTFEPKILGLDDMDGKLLGKLGWGNWKTFSAGSGPDHGLPINPPQNREKGLRDGEEYTGNARIFGTAAALPDMGPHVVRSPSGGASAKEREDFLKKCQNEAQQAQ